jgi:hypothetical protein
MSQRKNGYTLTAQEVESGFSNRSQIFAAYGDNAGWSPIP